MSAIQLQPTGNASPIMKRQYSASHLGTANRPHSSPQKQQAAHASGAFGGAKRIRRVAGGRAAQASNSPGVMLRRDDQTEALFVPLEGWPLFDVYREHYEREAGTVGDLVHGLRNFLIECAKHKDIICAACGGYGHHSKMCPTLGRLRKVAISSPLSARLLTRSLDASQPNNALHGIGPKTGISVPYVKPPSVKRPHR